MELLRLLARQRLLKIGDKGIMTIATKEAVEREANNLALLLQKYKLDPAAFNDIGTLRRTIRGLEELDLAGGLQDLAKKKTDNVFDLKGRKIEDTKNIMGGEEFKEKSIKKNIDEATEKGDFKGIFNQVMRDPEIAEEFKKIKAAQALADERALQTKPIPLDTIQYQGKEIQKMTGPEKQKYLITDDKQTAELLKKGYTFDDIIYAQDNYGLTAKEIMEEAAGATKKDPFPFATGGRAGYKLGSEGLKKIFNLMNKKSPLQAYKDYLKDVKEKTLKANETGKFMDLPLGEVGIPAATGALITRAVKKRLETENEKLKEKNFENFKKELEEDEFYKKYPELKDKLIERYVETEFGVKKADGGRIGLKVGSESKRAFLKLLAALGITGAAAKSGLVTLGGKQTGKQVVKEIVKTPNVAGKPEWFDTLVNKVIAEGVDKTDDLAYKERMVVHTKKISPNQEVAVYQDLEDGSVRINVGGPIENRAINDPDQIDLIVRQGKTEEGGFKTKDSFEASESEPRVVNQDGDMEFDGENVVNNVDDLMQDVSNLEEYATGKKLVGDKAKKGSGETEKI